jgi:hypothetical protein
VLQPKILSKTGWDYITLAYAIPTNDEAVSSVIIRGAEYNTNSGIVYNLLQSLTLNLPILLWVNAFHSNRWKEKPGNLFWLIVKVMPRQTLARRSCT